MLSKLSKKETSSNFKVRLALNLEDSYLDEHIYHTFEIPHVRVGEALKDKVDMWIPLNPILIDAGVGLGKTTFVYEELLPRALEMKKNILLISNRTALSLQQKTTLMDIIQDPRRGLLTTKGIQMEENFGRVKVITYHRLHGLLKDESNAAWLGNLAYVIADEAHFFAADSLFNEDCQDILQEFVRAFRHTVRIYMTATPWDVTELIANAEKKKKEEKRLDFSKLINTRPSLPPQDPRIIHYRFERDYSRYNLRFFDTPEEIAEIINAIRDEKFMVFIDSKEKAGEFRKMLQCSSEYLDSSLKESIEWQTLLMNEKFESQVMVCTSVLDCGVNIIDPELKNIVVFADNRTSVMQMVGRKRCQGNETVNVWVCDDHKAIGWRYKNVLDLLKYESEYNACATSQDYNYFTAKLWRGSNKELQKLFVLKSDGLLYKNKAAFFVLAKRAHFLGNIIEGKTTFRREVESWFGKQHPQITCELDEFFEKHGESLLGEELQSELRRIITDMYRRSGKTEAQPKRIDALQHTALSNRLRELNQPYEIRSQEGMWKLIYDPNLKEGSNEENKI